MANAKETPVDKGADNEPVKPPEYQRFEEVLKKVIKAPPMRKAINHLHMCQIGGSIPTFSEAIGWSQLHESIISL